MNQITDIELTGKDEPELMNLFSHIAAELAQINPNSPGFRVIEASLDTVRTQLYRVQSRAHLTHPLVKQGMSRSR